MMRPAIIGAIIALGLAVAGSALAQSVSTRREWSGPIVDFSVAAAAPAEPDVAAFNLGAVSRAPTAGAALAENARKVDGLIAAMRNGGVAERDLGTSTVTVERYTGRTGSFEGYTASNSVAVTVRDIRRAGPLIDAAFEAGADRLYSLRLQVEDPAPLVRQARRTALREAEARARDYADAAGFRSVRLIALAERDVQVRSRQEEYGEIVVSGTRVQPLARPRTATAVIGGDVGVTVSLFASYEMIR